MRAILIDPFAYVVLDVEYGGGFKGPAGAYKLIATDIIEVVYLSHPCTDLLLVDEKGTFKPENYGFVTSFFPGQPLLGRVLVTGGADAAGNFTAATLDVDTLRASITWLGAMT
jgi:hypothetical protein